MKCIFCDKDYYRHSTFFHAFFTKDPLCSDCRSAMAKKYHKIKSEDLLVMTFYDYSDLFKDLLLQYKECYDEALKEVFLYEIKDYLRLRYHDYTFIWVPSSQKDLQRRGFDHMRLMLENSGLKYLDALQKNSDLSQNLRSLKERQIMRQNIAIKEGVCIPKKVVLIDDVLTTGASMSGAYQALASKACKIACVALAYVRE